jgi:hypothetical protein
MVFLADENIHLKRIQSISKLGFEVYSVYK